MTDPIRGTLTVDLLGFWHAGGGLGGDFGADAVVRKEQDLPILPGRHLLGLITHKLEFLRRLPSSPVDEVTCVYLRGQGVDGFDDDLAPDVVAPGPPATRFESVPGALMVDTARMEHAWLRHVSALHGAGRAAFTAPFYRRFGTTRLKDGVADDHTLRHVEVTVPLTLTANIAIDGARVGTAPPDEAILKASVEQALGLVQHVGRHRTRGLGRARLSVQWEAS